MPGVLLLVFMLWSINMYTDNCRLDVALALDPIVHQSYNSPIPNSNDIALLRLAEKVNILYPFPITTKLRSLTNGIRRQSTGRDSLQSKNC